MVTGDAEHERQEEEAHGVKSETHHAPNEFRTRGHGFAMMLKLHEINNKQPEGFGDRIPNSSR